MDVIYAIIGFAVGISILVFVHELGHYLMARWFGVRVEKFSIGFPPKIISWTKGDTEYVIGATPLGGYVKMAGAIDENMDGTVTGAPDEFMSKSTFAKSMILLGGVLFNIIFAIIVFFAVTLFNGETVRENQPITEMVQFSDMGRLFSDRNFTIVSVAGEPIEYANDIARLIGANYGSTYQVEIELEDGTRKLITIPQNVLPDENFLRSLTAGWGLKSTITVEQVVPNSVSEEAGLQKGDVIVSVAGRPIDSFAALENAKAKHANETISVSFLRGTDTITAQMAMNPDDKGRVLIGFAPRLDFAVDQQAKIHRLDYSVGEAAGIAVSRTFGSVAEIFRMFGILFRGDMKASDAIGGPVTIARELGRSLISFSYFFTIVAIISVMLAVMNILPIPGLDGGHLVITLIEGARGKQLSIDTKTKILKFGIVILVSLMIFAISVDVNRLFQ